METTHTTGDNMSNGISYGSKYNRDLDIAQIAKLVRADIKAAVKEGTLPKGFKASVRISRYSMGQSLNVTVKAAPGVTIMNPLRLAHEESGSREVMTRDELLDTVKSIVDAYNYDGSDSQSDYYNVNFYGFVDFAHELEQSERDASRVAACNRITFTCSSRMRRASRQRSR